MPFQFVCPFCHARTNVEDKYLGQSGLCANCGKPVQMPTRNERGVLVHPISEPRKAPLKESTAGTNARGKTPWVLLISTAAGFMLLSVCLIVLMWPQIALRIDRAAQVKDIEKMRMIAKALTAYADQYGTYPPAAVVDASGTKLYSWRVLILPFLGYETLYKKFVLDQPWDGVANFSLLKEMPKEYASSFSTDAANLYESNFTIIVGSGTLFPPTGALDPSKITDDPTILLIETLNGNAVWTQPVDLDASKGLKIGSRPNVEAGGLHQEDVLAISTSEKTLRLPKKTPQSVLDSLVSPNGTEQVDASPFLVD